MTTRLDPLPDPIICEEIASAARWHRTADVAAFYGISSSTVRRIAQVFPGETDFPSIPGKPTASLLAAEAIVLFRRGLRLTEIGDQLGITGERVRQLLRAQGVDVTRERVEYDEIRKAIGL